MGSSHLAAPGVSVFLTVRNEADHLAGAVERIFAQCYEGPLEVVLALGPSSDATASEAARLAERFPALVVVDNPSGRTPEGLNRAWRSARHDYLIRVDGHALLPPGYIERVVSVLEQTGAANVGGMMVPEGTAPFQKAVARAMSSPFGIGAEAFHTGGAPGPAKTVYLGAFRRADLEAVGGFNEAFTRAQDWELNYRLINAGKLVWFDPQLGVVYRPRRTWRALLRQFYQTGRWRAHLIRQYPRTASARYLAAPAATVGVGIGGVAGLLGLVARSKVAPLALAVPVLYALGVLGASVVASRGLDRPTRRRLPLAMATMHLAWGAGFLRATLERGRTGPRDQGT
ncbi:MAG: glycosyltransferase family 2 protein [Bifidobacteriaceae bacterium]|jgi:glycosyltransferase involved in cell wall biosynthesis|nr:glycosyltransferase family 2 protein [Bifidobacteriaceae bacterium]